MTVTHDAGQQLRTALGRALRDERDAAGWSLRELAERAGVAHTSLYGTERGESWPSAEVLTAYCAALGVDVADLLDRVAAEWTRLEMAKMFRPTPHPSLNWNLNAPAWALERCGA